MQKWFVLPALVALLVLASGCTQEAPSEQPSTPVHTPTAKQTSLPKPSLTPAPTAPVTTLSVSETTITINDNTFTPANMTVKVGSTVRWVNEDDHVHRIEFANKMFSASTYLLGAGQSASSVPFVRPGTYDYDCLIHPYMHGTITVVE
jgi:plastocyanin